MRHCSITEGVTSYYNLELNLTYNSECGTSQTVFTDSFFLLYSIVLSSLLFLISAGTLENTFHLSVPFLSSYLPSLFGQ